MTNYRTYESAEHLHLVFLGCGDIASKHVGRIRKADKNISISFASRTTQKADDYKKKFKGNKSYDSYDKAITDPEVDIVFITTPPHLHYDLAKKAIENGKHVIVEKPPFFKAAHVTELGQLADAQGLQLLIAENYYYRPMRYRVKELIEEGVIGQPLFINLSATKKQKSKDDWRDQEKLAKYGALFEGGIHWVNFMNNMGFDITDVHGYQPRKQDKLERSMQVTANTEEGAIINLQYSWEVDTLLFGLRLSRIYGTEGSITFESNGVSLFVRGKKKRLQFPRLQHITGFGPMFKDFFTSLRAGKQPEFSYHLAEKDMLLIEQVYASINKE